MESVLEIIRRDVLALGCRCGRSRSSSAEPVRIHLPADSRARARDNMILFAAP